MWSFGVCSNTRNKSPFQVPCSTCTQRCHSSRLVFLLILSRISAYFYCCVSAPSLNFFIMNSIFLQKFPFFINFLSPCLKRKKEKQSYSWKAFVIQHTLLISYGKEEPVCFSFKFYFTYTPLMMIFQAELPVLLMKMHY